MQEGMQKGMEKGMEKGMQKGMQEGKSQGILEVATKLKSLHLPTDQIKAATGLSEEDIEKL